MQDIAKEAEQAILALKKQNNGKIYLKTNQIRKFLTAVNAITNKVNVYKAKHLDATELPNELAGEIQFFESQSSLPGRKRTKCQRFYETE